MGGKTSALSRDHVIHVDTSGLLTITGGKWTTYRHMAEDCVDHAITLGRLPDWSARRRTCRFMATLERARRVGDTRTITSMSTATDAEAIRALAQDPALGARCIPICPTSAAEVVWAAREEMARTRGRRAGAENAGAVPECAMRPWPWLSRSRVCWPPNWAAMKLGAAQVTEFRALAKQYTGVLRADSPGGQRWRRNART